MKLGDRLPSRLPPVLFAVLALATVGAFYITQHLKTKNPLINGSPRADPPVINPRDAGVCLNELGTKPVSYRKTSIGFFLQSKSDKVTVNVISPEDVPVATMTGSGRYIHAATPTDDHYAYFGWDGRLSNGTYAPDGTYTFRVVLSHEDRDLPIGGASVQVESSRPRPRVGSVTVGAATGTTTTDTTTSGTTTSGTTTSGTTATATTPVGATPSFTPGRQSATVHLVPGRYKTGNVLVYRATGQPAAPLKLVFAFGINPRIRTATWNGMINGRPAPAGTYLLGLRVTNRSCTSGQYPVVDDPSPHSTAGAGVNVSYLSADPPTVPTPAGQLASVGVETGGPYTWALRRAGVAKVIFHGTGSRTGSLRVRMPGAGLYALTLISGSHRTSVPLVASAVGARAAARVLVVLPALSWQGANATDDDSDGLIDTLSSGGQIDLERPLVAGQPADLANEAAMLRFLDAAGDAYDITTDVALAEGVGPALTGRHGVLLDGTFTWLPAQLVSQLHRFVQTGGDAFAAGVRSLESSALISDGTDGPIAGPAKPLAVDPFGVRHGTVSPAYGQIITSLSTDALGIFPSDLALESARYQVLTPAAGRVSSAAGVADSAVSIVGFHLGSGTVVEAGLPDFGSSLASDPYAGELLSQVWHVVLR